MTTRQPRENDMREERLQDFKRRLTIEMELRYEWVAEEYGMDATGIRKFQDDFSNRFYEFNDWWSGKKRQHQIDRKRRANGEKAKVLEFKQRQQ